MTVGVPDAVDSFGGRHQWGERDVVSWLEHEPTSCLSEGIKFACWRKHTNQSYFSRVRQES